MSQRRKSWSLPLLLVSRLILLHVVVVVVNGKKISGDFKLSGVNTEVLLASFAVLPHSGAMVEATFSAPDRYESSQQLHVRAYRDTEWPAFLKEPLCTGKTELAKQSVPIRMAESESGKWTFFLGMEIANVETTVPTDDPKERKLVENPRNHYWYFVIDDCSLEQYFHDNKVPTIHYEMTVQNYSGKHFKRRLTHLSADETPLLRMLVFSLIASLMVTFLLLMNIVWRLNDKSKSHSVHAAVLWVAGAAALDACSALLELIHLNTYHKNGVGVYWIDALSAHMEACCDASLMIFLLSMAAGWTLPSSVVTMVVNPAHANPVQKLLAGLAHPISDSMLHGPTGMLAGTVLLVHIVLAQWGRVYNDDFESYHDLEHLPGRILMWTRVTTGLLFLVAVRQTVSSAHNKFSVALTKFYNVFSVAGFFWFQSLPFLTWWCHWAVPYYLRRPYVFAGSAFLQSGSIVILAWLVTTHSTAYHKYSRMTESRETLGDSLEPEASPRYDGAASPSSPKEWMVGKKAKVRLD